MTKAIIFDMGNVLVAFDFRHAYARRIEATGGVDSVESVDAVLPTTVLGIPESEFTPRVRDAHVRVEAHLADGRLHAPGEVSVLVGGVWELAVESPHGAKGGGSIRDVAREVAPSVVVEDR